MKDKKTVRFSLSLSFSGRKSCLKNPEACSEEDAAAGRHCAAQSSQQYIGMSLEGAEKGEFFSSLMEEKVESWG